jgi:hypothetical protein
MLTDLGLPNVTKEVQKIQDWIGKQNNKTKQASDTVFDVQTTFRAWLIEKGICEDADVDRLLPELAREGVSDVKHLDGFDKDDLKQCGFNTRQAIAVLKALKK